MSGGREGLDGGALACALRSGEREHDALRETNCSLQLRDEALWQVQRGERPGRRIDESESGEARIDAALIRRKLAMRSSIARERARKELSRSC